MWLKKNKWKMIISALVFIILATAFWYGGGAPGMQGWEVKKDTAPLDTVQLRQETQQVQASAQSAQTPEPDTKPDMPTPSSEPSSAPLPDTQGGEIAVGSTAGGMEIATATDTDRCLAVPVPEEMPTPVEPQDVKVSDTAHTCTLSICCDTILNHIEWLDKEMVELVPEDGVILPATAVTFYEGESVFNVLVRVCKQNGIHMEFKNTPIYNSAYIQGIHNLYEFACGDLSGWMYKVNGWFPNYGCSRYALQEGDVIEWVYTCDLGNDVCGAYAAGKQ